LADRYVWSATRTEIEPVGGNTQLNGWQRVAAGHSINLVALHTVSSVNKYNFIFPNKINKRVTAHTGKEEGGSENIGNAENTLLLHYTDQQTNDVENNSCNL
jgi:hypothetical protein